MQDENDRLMQMRSNVKHGANTMSQWESHGKIQWCFHEWQKEAPGDKKVVHNSKNKYTFSP